MTNGGGEQRECHAGDRDRTFLALQCTAYSNSLIPPPEKTTMTFHNAVRDHRNAKNLPSITYSSQSNAEHNRQAPCYAFKLCLLFIQHYARLLVNHLNGIGGPPACGDGGGRWNICTSRLPTPGSNSVPSLAIFTSLFAFHGFRSPRVR